MSNIDTVYQENRALEDQIHRLKLENHSMSDRIERLTAEVERLKAREKHLEEYAEPEMVRQVIEAKENSRAYDREIASRHHITDEDERWLSVYEWEGLYEVSDQGRVRSLGGKFSQKHGSGEHYQRTKYGRVLAPGADGKGYMTVCLCHEGREETKRVHQLVLQSFIGSAPDGMECRHLDGTKDNNILGNLRWGTRKENAADRLTHGTDARGTNMHSSILDEDSVIDIRKRVAAGEKRSVVADDFGVAERTVSAIISGQTWGWLRTCEGCGGSGQYIATTDTDGRPWPDCCPNCAGRGWVKK